MSYAAQYVTFPELVSAGIILCTMVSAPLMYVSTEILTVYHLNFDDDVLNRSFNIAVASIIGIHIILAIFIISKSFLHMPHTLTTSLTVQCLISPISSVLGFYNFVSSHLQVNKCLIIYLQFLPFIFRLLFIALDISPFRSAQPSSQ